MNHSLKFILLVSFVILAGCATKSLEPTSVATRYQRVHTAPVPAVSPCAAVSRVVVEDARVRPELGTRTLQEKPDLSQPIQWRGDLAQWVGGGMEDALKRSGAATGGADKPTLRLKVERLDLSENVHRRATYDGRVSLKVELVAAGATSACFRTDIKGASSNYGYAGSAENYDETLNHALDRATEQLLLQSEFANKLCNCARR